VRMFLKKVGQTNITRKPVTASNGNSRTPSRVARHKAMDRTTIRNHLEQARRHVADSERHIALQRQIVAEKERDGHDTSISRQLLGQFEQIYAMYLAERDRLEKELDEVSK
jgi:hypothetical protein